MEFNYGLEKKKFDEEWEKLRKEYLEAGMSEEAIQEMREYDWNIFKQKRTSAKHEQFLDGLLDSNNEDVLEDRNPLMTKYFEALKVEDKYFCAKGRFSWINEIENEKLYEKIINLPDKDKELLSLLVVDELGIRKIARLKNKAPSTICEKIHRIKKILT